MPLADVPETELQSMLIDLNKLTVDYPKGANRAAKILELAMERATSLRNSVRKQRRDMEIRQQATKGMREAKTLAMFQSEMKQFADKLPGDTVATEFAEALREADHWKRVDDWNAWCKRLADLLASQLDDALAKFPDLEPELVCVFGGVIEPNELRFPFNRMPETDARDWSAIRAWTADAAALFGKTAAARSLEMSRRGTR